MIIKQRQRHKNSSFITRAIIENNNKFLFISKMYNDYKKSCVEKKILMMEIMKIYSMVFKRFSAKKILLGTIDGLVYFATPKGLARAYTYSHIKRKVTEDLAKNYKTNIKIYQEIVNIGKNRNALIQNMNKTQRKIFNGFFKYHKYLKEEPKVILKIKPSEIIEILPLSSLLPSASIPIYKMKQFNEVYLAINRYGHEEDFDIIYSLNNQIIENVKFNRLYFSNGVNEKIIIEQTFCQLKSLFKKETTNRKKEIRRLNAMKNKIKKQFADYILLNIIEKDEI
jgi:hypothetical protein